MIRHLKILLFGMVVIGLMAGSAFAGTTRSNHGAANGMYDISLEAMGAARNVTIQSAGAPNTAAGNAPISYAFGQALTTGNLLEITFSGAAFDGTQLNVCALNGAGNGISIATYAPTAGSAAANFQTSFGATANVAVGNYVWLTIGAAGNCLALDATSQNVPVQISTTTSAVTPTVRFRTLTSGGIEVDTSSAANLARVKAEYAVGNNFSNHTIDYLGTPGNGTRVISNALAAANVTADSNAAAVSNVVNVTRTANNTNANTGAGNAGLTVAAVVGLTDSASWQGISRLYLVQNATACTFGANVVTKTTPSGTVSLNIPAATWAGAASNQYNLCLEANGTDALQTRTIQASIDVNVTGTGANDPGAGAFANAQLWGLNAYQAWVPWMVNSTVLPTYCLISNGEATRTASVIFDVVSSEGAVTLLNQSLGTIAPLTSTLAIFTGDSATLGTGTAVSLSTLGADKRYAGRLTVTANPTFVNMNCNQTDPAGAKRGVPVLSSGNSPFKQ